MAANPDFKELFSIFNEEKVEYLVIGAHAVMFYTGPRYTKDLDIWVNPSADNAARVYKALKRFGAPLEGVAPNDLADPNLVYQVGIEPNRFDIQMGTEALDFGAAWPNRSRSSYDGVPINILGKGDLIKTKRACARPQDLIDAEKLSAIPG